MYRIDEKGSSPPLPVICIARVIKISSEPLKRHLEKNIFFFPKSQNTNHASFTREKTNWVLPQTLASK